MNDEELQALKKEVSKCKRIATDHASLIHDLVEDRLLSDYGDLVELAEKTVAACEAWAAKNAEFKMAKSGAEA